MKIKEEIINKFGKLKDVDISLDDRITVIKGKNEAGKSTISGFIRYMLYGFAGRSTSLSDNTKKKFMPWDENECGGEMDFSISNAKTYTALRKTAARNASSIIDNEIGEPLDSDCAGEEFLGVSDTCYKKTAFIGQNDIVFSDEGELENAIHNIVYAADESADTGEVIKKLDEARKYFLTKNGKGGKIFEIENELSHLREEKQKWQSGHKELLGAEHTLGETKNKLEFNRQKLSSLEKEIRNKQCYEAKQKLSEIEKCKNAAIASKEALVNKQKELQHDAFVPDEDFKARITDAATVVLRCRESVKRQSEQEKETAKNLTKAYSNERHKNIADRLCESGRSAEETANELKTLIQKKKNALVVAIILTILVITLPVAIVFYVKHGKANARIKQMLTFFGIPNSDELYALLCANSAFSSAAQTAKQVHEQSLSGVQKALEEQKNAENALSELLLCAGVKADTHIYDAATEYIKKLSVYLSELSECKRICNDDFVRYNTLLGSVDIEKLSQEADIYDETVAFRDDKTLRQEYAFYTQSIQALSDKERELEKKAAVLSGTLPKPSEIESRISSLEFKKGEMQEKHDALVMALEAVEKASQNIKNTASPYITSRSGELFARLTSGKYKALFADKQMQLSFLESTDADVRDAMYLSFGTRSLSYLCLRIALCEYLYKEKPVLVFDDAFAFVDDERLKIFMELLVELSADFQIIILSCHEREAQLLAGRAKIVDFKVN